MTGPESCEDIGFLRPASGWTSRAVARMEGMTKGLCYPLLISESTWETFAEKPQFEKLPPRFVRGRKTAIVLYASAASPA